MKTQDAVKCPCQHCDGHIAFDPKQFQTQGGSSAGALGPTVTCPHCGMETIVFIPQPTATKVEPASSPKPSHGPLLLKIGIVVCGIALLAGFIYLLITNSQFGTAAFGLGSGVAVLVIGAFLLVLAILWIIFPLFVYFSLKRLEKLLEQIERNTRKQQSQP